MRLEHPKVGMLAGDDTVAREVTRKYALLKLFSEAASVTKKVDESEVIECFLFETYCEGDPFRPHVRFVSGSLLELQAAQGSERKALGQKLCYKSKSILG
jgi:hypothetical protein